MQIFKKPMDSSDYYALGTIGFVIFVLYVFVKITGYGTPDYSSDENKPTRNISSYVGCQMAIEN